jgi:mono/diheme cytochrome c family protein
MPVLNFLLLFAPLPAAAPLTPAEEAFERKVRPILFDHCVGCHGPKKKMGDLRLDTRAGLLQGGESGPAIKPGDPDGSRLIRAVRHVGKLKMPKKDKLKPEAVAVLADWIKAGAPWPKDPTKAPDDQAWKRHWAFQPVKDAPVPLVKNADWPRTPLDRFVLSRLESKGLTPSPEADRRTLIRRLSFDLIGLPPTPAQMEDFLGDQRADAYERLVDRLLASPHYGERWGRYWLDIARYADTRGYVFLEDTSYPWAYTYRDYVIRSFNRDLPYDTFILEQLAADKLPIGKDRRPLTGLGYLTLGGRFMNNVQDILDDKIDVVTRGLMGLTVSCARCHDHKFDPVPTADYYSLYGVFASCSEPVIPPVFEDPPNPALYAKFTAEMAKREKALADFVKGKQREVFQGARTRVAEYMLAVHARKGQPRPDNFMLIADGADLNPAMLSRWQAYLERTARKHDRVWAPWHRFATLSKKDFPEKAKEISKSLATNKEINPLVARAFVAKPPANLAEAARRYADVLLTTEKMWQETLTKSATTKQLSDADREELRRVFHGPNAPPDVPPGAFSDLELLPDRASQDKLQKFRKAVEQWRVTGAGAPARANTLVDLENPVQPRVFRRGNPNNPGPAVPRRFLSALSGPKSQPFREGSGRLELARAIVDPKNPLTARVQVNRVWMHLFGQGLVTTPGDFGLRGEPPSHPELLDHLTVAFVRDGWSIKNLQRRILLSAAYRQGSGDRANARRVDPENQLIWRMNRRRLDFEATRDALLAVAGRLDHSLGGPSVKDFLGAGPRRRTLYGHLDRQYVPSLHRTFDFPSPDASTPRRDSTTVAPQALFFLNSPFVMESARGLTSQLGSDKDLNGRVLGLYRLCYGRSPTAEEMALAREFLGMASAETWHRYAQSLLLTNEFVFVD